MTCKLQQTLPVVLYHPRGFGSGYHVLCNPGLSVLTLIRIWPRPSGAAHWERFAITPLLLQGPSQRETPSSTSRFSSRITLILLNSARYRQREEKASESDGRVTGTVATSSPATGTVAEQENQPDTETLTAPHKNKYGKGKSAHSAEGAGEGGG